MYPSLLLSLLFLPTEGQVEITPITHGSVVLTWQNKTIYVDPWSQGNLAQLPAEVAQAGYPETIFVNGQVVSMDDTSASTQVGSVYQAIAIKNDKIMKLGNNQEVRALAGPDTRVHDLKGRTLIPGIIEPHMHMRFGSAHRLTPTVR